MMVTEEPGLHKGEQTFRKINLPGGCVGNAQVKLTDPLAQEKLEHQHRVHFSQPVAVAAAAERRPVHLVHGTDGRILGIKLGLVVACIGDATISVDVLKNGQSILTAPVVLDSEVEPYSSSPAPVQTAGLLQGDVLEVQVTVSAGTGTLGQGVFVSLNLAEDAE